MICPRRSVLARPSGGTAASPASGRRDRAGSCCQRQLLRKVDELMAQRAIMSSSGVLIYSGSRVPSEKQSVSHHSKPHELGFLAPLD